jgi:cell division protein FtsA
MGTTKISAMIAEYQAEQPAMGSRAVPGAARLSTHGGAAQTARSPADLVRDRGRWSGVRTMVKRGTYAVTGDHSTSATLEAGWQARVAAERSQSMESTALAPLRMIGVGTATAEGLKQGVVVDIERAAAAVAHAVKEAEQMAGLSVRTYNVGVAGEHIRSMNSRGVVAVPDLETEICEDDVARALDAARKFSLPYDREIIHTLPQEYIVDSQRGVRHPAGMYGSRLEARVHVVTAARPALDNVAKALRLAGVEIGEMVVEPLASSYAAVTPEERQIGVMLLDIGGGTTDVMLFVDGGVVASGVIGIGGNNITNDLAYGLRTSQQHAEEIKIRHGCAMTSMIEGEDTIEVPTIGFGGSRRVAKHLLSGIIEPRVTELFSLINAQISENNLKNSLGAGLVLTGGSAMLDGVKELAEQVFELPVRIGFPFAVDGLVEVVSHPKYSTGVGLLYTDGEAQTKRLNRVTSAQRLRHSFRQLVRAISSFI